MALADRIRHKYRLKNTMGYALNALLDYQRPMDILIHLMVGSEGTLGFIAEVVLDTIADHPHKATALVFFPLSLTSFPCKRPFSAAWAKLPKRPLKIRPTASKLWTIHGLRTRSSRLLVSTARAETIGGLEGGLALVTAQSLGCAAIGAKALTGRH